MAIRTLLGIWHDKTTVLMSVDACAEMGVYLGSSRLRLKVVPAVRMAVIRSDRERGLVPCRAGEETYPDMLRLDGARCQDVARCRLFEVEFRESRGRSGNPSLVCQLPPDHRMPWPRIRSECDLYWPPDEVFKEVMQRRRSCMAGGDRWEMPPGSITRHLGPRHRLQLADMRHMDAQDASLLNGRRAA